MSRRFTFTLTIDSRAVSGERVHKTITYAGSRTQMLQYLRSMLAIAEGRECPAECSDFDAEAWEQRMLAS